MVWLFFIVELITMLHMPHNNYVQPLRIAFQEKNLKSKRFLK